MHESQGRSECCGSDSMPFADHSYFLAQNRYGLAGGQMHGRGLRGSNTVAAALTCRLGSFCLRSKQGWPYNLEAAWQGQMDCKQVRQSKLR